MNKDLTTLTAGERLWLWRRQEGLTGHEAAAFLGVGRGLYWEAEAGRRPLPTGVRTPSPGRPSVEDLLALARRRAGWGLLGTARKAKITHPTLLAWERTGAQNLLIWWENRGFTFVRTFGYNP